MLPSYSSLMGQEGSQQGPAPADKLALEPTAH